jgi:hypothetical protein
MKHPFAIGLAAVSLLALTGAGCGQQTQTSPTSPAGETQENLEAPGEMAQGTTPSNPDIDLTQDDLDALERDINALQAEDLNALQN